MKRLWFVAIVAAIGVASLGTLAWAAVTIPAVTVPAKSGQTVYIPISLTADQAVAGINGELTYDSTQFSNPTIFQTAQAAGFTVLGNSPSAGKYRFVVYSDPTALLTLGQPLVYIKMNVVNALPLPRTATMSYTISAASSADGVSLSGVTFNNVTVEIGQSQARNWTLYQ